MSASSSGKTKVCKTFIVCSIHTADSMRGKPNKYRNVKTERDGILFDSAREADRYVILKAAERSGFISNLELQPKFELIPAIRETYVKHLKTKDKICVRTVQLPITYTADFAYDKNEIRVIEDVKISPRLLPKELTLKVKMMRYFHGISVRLVYKANETI